MKTHKHKETLDTSLTTRDGEPSVVKAESRVRVGTPTEAFIGLVGFRRPLRGGTVEGQYIRGREAKAGGEPVQYSDVRCYTISNWSCFFSVSGVPGKCTFCNYIYVNKYIVCLKMVCD